MEEQEIESTDKDGLRQVLQNYACSSDENLQTVTEILQAMELVTQVEKDNPPPTGEKDHGDEEAHPLLPLDNPQVNFQKVQKFLDLRNSEALKSMAKRMDVFQAKYRDDVLKDKILALVNEHQIPFELIYKLHIESNVKLNSATKTFSQIQEEPLRPHMERILAAPFTGLSFMNGTAKNRNICYVDQSFNTILSSYEIRKLVHIRYRECPALAVLKTYLDHPKQINDGNLGKRHLAAYFNLIGEADRFNNYNQQCAHEFIHFFIR